MEDFLVSVITPTWHRPQTIVDYGINSVRVQDYPNIEHLIFVDGPDDEIDEILEREGYSCGKGRLRYYHLGRNWTAPEIHAHSNGTIGRQVGTYFAAGDFITYLDDDNIWERNHISSMMDCLMERGANIVLSDVRGPNGDIWPACPVTGNLDTSGFLHHWETLLKSNWNPRDGYCCDGALVERLVEAGATWARKEGATVTLPSARRGAPD